MTVRVINNQGTPRTPKNFSGAFNKVKIISINNDTNFLKNLNFGWRDGSGAISTGYSYR